MARGSDEEGLHWPVLLMNFSIVHTWDWGSIILAVLYKFMDSFSRHNSPYHRGMSMPREVFTLLLFLVLNSFTYSEYLNNFYLCLAVLVRCLHRARQSGFEEVGR